MQCPHVPIAMEGRGSEGGCPVFVRIRSRFKFIRTASHGQRATPCLPDARYQWSQIIIGELNEKAVGINVLNLSTA